MRILHRDLSINALLSAGYFVGGILGHIIAATASHISPVWPAAGIALAGILVYGHRVLPGLILGAAVTQAYVFFEPSHPETLSASVSAGFLVGLACALQAVFGGFIIRRFVGPDNPLIDGPSIFRFLALAAPVSCVITPSIGIGVLLGHGMVGVDDWWHCWLVWWVGDMMGVILVTPLVYLPLGPAKAHWKSRRRFVAYPLLFSLLVVFVLFSYGNSMEAERLKALFSQQVTLVHGEINKRLDHHVKTNLALKAFLDSAEDVDDSKFRRYAAALRAAFPSLLALEWTPWVGHDQRAGLESDGRWLIKEKNSQGELVVSGPKPFYLPIRFVEPLAGNERALGFDIYSNRTLRPIIKTAISQGVTVASGGVQLVQDILNNRLGIVLYAPVYKKNQLLLTEYQRQQAFMGFAATVFRVGDEINGVFAGLPNVQLQVTIKDSLQQGVLFSHRSTPYQTKINANGLVDNRSLGFAGRTWLINFQPAEQFFISQRSRTFYWPLLGGFSLSALTCFGVLLLTGKTLGIEALVQEKTRDLRKANARLKAEIVQREFLQAQQEIKNEVLELLAQNQPITVILDAITQNWDRLYSGQHCSILLFDDKHQALHCASAPNLPDFYIQALEGVRVGPGVGSCGAAVFTKQVAVAEDLLSHPNWQDFRDLMLKTPYRSCWSHPILAADGRVLGTFALYQEQNHSPAQSEKELIKQMAHLVAITLEHKQSEQELLIAATTFQSHEAIMVTDQHANILRVNQAFCDITGYSEAEVIGKNPKILTSGIHNDDYYKNMYRSMAEKGRWEGEIWNRKKNGQIFPEWLTLTVVKNQQDEVVNYVAIFSDISEIKAAEKEIHDLAYYDPLTHLPNRRLLLERLACEINFAKNKRRYGALFFLDLDRFKTLNDSLGHHIGDELLIQVAGRLKSLVADGGTVARLGGDEFIVLAQGNSKSLQQAAESARDLAEKIVSDINQPYHVLGMAWHFTASIGVTLFPDADEPAEALIQQADTAMYWAKESGRNGISFFNPGMHEHADRRLTLEHELHRALQEGHLQMYYQSQVDDKGKLVGAEALIRWMDPVKGIVSPAEFIPLA